VGVSGYHHPQALRFCIHSTKGSRVSIREYIADRAGPLKPTRVCSTQNIEYQPLFFRNTADRLHYAMHACPYVAYASERQQNSE
jgi:hypothetical protein